ncbi:truncated two-component sensor kinase [Lacticaseibacillus casei DSM 20011 = JCM 1134 = ATCC 393]|uniref:Truncated two-component sensor kinase n=1 Tax=Lacticaseibacillus casei DSM 20011 = JCM 1134 = ATCC 393 TaxID=1423732 RepID=A0AAD1ESV6_LACCA|nr:truncated two-component sensor kinase [Lacticaseibacillus casei DSM 20011 = JCM 1134 = ATCC 393]
MANQGADSPKSGHFRSHYECDTPSAYIVNIQDDGRSKNYVRAGSNGISGMQQRMAEVNGTFAIIHNRQGTLVTLTLPKEWQQLS